MLGRSKGFSLPEVLLAMGLGSIIALGAMRFLPALQRGILHGMQRYQTEELLWQLAISIGKSIQRAGYCNGNCGKPGLLIGLQGRCLITRWDMNSNGQWEIAPPGMAEQIGYRLVDSDVETRRGGDGCQGSGWQKMNDPAALRVTAFRVSPLEGSQTLTITLAGISPRHPAMAPIRVIHSVERRNR